MVVFSNLGGHNGVRHLFMCCCFYSFRLCVCTIQLGLLYTIVENTVLCIICLCVVVVFCCCFSFRILCTLSS